MIKYFLSFGILAFFFHASLASQVAMKPLQGEWKDDSGSWETLGQRPPAGWYLRSLSQYDVGRFSFDFKKAAAGDIVFVYLKDWQIIFRPDSVTARFNGFLGPGKPPYRLWDYYWFGATRPLSLADTDWHRAEVSLVDGGIVLQIGGAEILRFNSPEKEWGERVRSSGKFPAFPNYAYPQALPGYSQSDQVLIVHGYGSGLSVRDISVDGKDAGPAEGFPEGKALSAVFPQDDQLPLLRPTGTVKVDWQLKESLPTDGLPPVEQWALGGNGNGPNATALFQLPSLDAVAKAASFPEVMTYRVGAVDPGKIPDTLRLRRAFPSLPQEGRVEFALAKPGVYTLQLAWGPDALGWGPQVVEVSVDGRPILRDVYRSFGQNSGCSPGVEAIPLELAAGPHRVDVGLVTDRYGYHYLMKHLFFRPAEISLTPGIHTPWKIANVAEPTELTQRSPATEDSFAVGDWSGASLNYRLTGLNPNTPYKLKLVFWEYESSHPGGRIMRLSINGETREPSLDLFAESGWGVPLDRRYTVVANERGEIDLSLAGLKGKAIINGLILSDKSGKEIFRENFGWHAATAARVKMLQARELEAVLAKPSIPEAPPEWTPAEPFDGHNLVANPHFSLEDQSRQGKPRFWYSVKEMSALSSREYNPKDLEAFDPALARQLVAFQGGKQPEFLSFYGLYQGDGRFAWDPSVGHSQPGSLRIDEAAPGFGLMCNMPLIDPHKRQRFSLYARGDGTVRAVVLWFAMNMDADARWRDRGGAPLLAPRLQYIGSSEGDKVRPGDAWTEISVEAKPPAEAFYAVLVAAPSDLPTGGKLWIDDAAFDGYGAEPLEITQSYAGYHPSGVKSVIVKSVSGTPVTWSMTSADGKLVAEGTLESFSYQWFSKRHYFTLDFGNVTSPGNYTLKVTQGTESVAAPILISEDIYANLARIELEALRTKRFNHPAENARDPDLLDYAAVPKTRSAPRFCVYEPLIFPERIDLTGGYYDAGDEIQHAEFWPSVILATTNAREDAGPHGNIAEAAAGEFDWITAAFHKFALEDGTFYTSAKPQGYGLDNVPGYATDPLPEQERNMSQAAGSCAMAAYLLRKSDPKLSREYLEIAEKSYNNPGLWKLVQAAGEVGPKEISAAAKALWAEMYLAEISQAADYKARMDKSARVLAQGLKNRAYADLVEMFHASDQNGAALQDCVWVPVRFIRMYPNHPAVPALKEGLRAFADHVGRLSADTIWGQATAMNAGKDGGKPGLFPSDGTTYTRNIGYWPMLTYSLAETGMVLGDPNIIHLAERQLQWCLGKNMADLSIVQGVGERVVSGGDRLSWRDMYFSHWLKSPDRAMIIPGNVPTMAFRDVGSSGAESIARISGGDMGAPFTLYPKGYLISGVQPPYGTMPGAPSAPSEIYLPQLAQMLLAASSVDAGLRWIADNPQPDKKPHANGNQLP